MKHEKAKDSEKEKTRPGLNRTRSNPNLAFGGPYKEFFDLQQTVGNRALGSLIQPKLKVSQQDDPLEKEADRIADQVMSMTEPKIHSEAKREEMTRKPATKKADIVSDQGQGIPDCVGNRIGTVLGGGSPLQEYVRTPFEFRFGYDFGRVRIHTDKQAADAAERLNARAFTIGQDIFFRRGEYNVNSQPGRRLMAHELTHVVQQNRQLINTKTQFMEIPCKQFLAKNSEVLMRKGKNESQKEKSEIPFFSILGYGDVDILGYANFHYVWGDVKRFVFVGSQDFWEKILQNPEEEHFQFWLHGFLFAATNPNFPRKVDQCERAPEEPEILEFMLALYKMGRKLKLLPRGFLDIAPEELRIYLRELISKYQGKVIKALSKEGVGAIPRVGITAVAEQVGEKVRPQMVGSAAKCATKAVIELIKMHVTKNDKGKWEAYQMITNAGIVIRQTLDVHNAKFEGDTIADLILDFVFDITKLDEIVGIQTVLRRLGIVKKILSNLFEGIIEGTGEEPNMQGKVIFDNFRHYVSSLKKDEYDALNADLANDAISAFNNGLSKK